MKRKNIKVGEWVFAKDEEHLALVNHIDEAGKVYASNKEEGFSIESSCLNEFRRPRISDLKPGDVFEWEGEEWTLNQCYGDNASAEIREGVGVNKYLSISAATKVRIISLASEKVEPERKRDKLTDEELEDIKIIAIDNEQPRRITKYEWLQVLDRLLELENPGLPGEGLER